MDALNLLLSRGSDTTDVEWVERISTIIRHSPLDALRKRDEAGNLAIHVACLQGHVAIVRLLLEMDSSLAHATSSITGFMPMHCAALSGRVEVVRLLLSVAPQTSRSVSRANGNLLPEQLSAKYGFHEVEALLRGSVSSSPSSSLRHLAKFRPIEADAPAALQPDERQQHQEEEEEEKEKEEEEEEKDAEVKVLARTGKGQAGEGILGSALQLLGRDELSPRAAAIVYPSASNYKPRSKKPTPQVAVIETAWPVGPEGDNPLKPTTSHPVPLLAPMPAPAPPPSTLMSVTPRAAEARTQALRRAALEKQQQQRRAVPKTAVCPINIDLGAPTHRVPRPMASDGCTAFSPRLWAFYSSLERALSQGQGLVGIDHPDPGLAPKLRSVYDEFVSYWSKGGAPVVGSSTLQPSLPSMPSMPSLPEITLSELSQSAPSPPGSPAQSRSFSWRADSAPRPESEQEIIKFWNDAKEQTGDDVADEEEEDQGSLCSDGLSRGFLRYLLSSDNLSRYTAASPEDAREEGGGACGAAQQKIPRGTAPSAPSRRGPFVGKRPPAPRFGVILAISTQAVDLPDGAASTPPPLARSPLPPGRTKPLQPKASFRSAGKAGDRQGEIQILVPPTTLPPPLPASSPRKISATLRSQLLETQEDARPVTSLPPPRTDFGESMRVYPSVKNIFAI